MMVPTHVPQPDPPISTAHKAIATCTDECDVPVAVEEHLERTDSIYALTVTKVVQTGWHSGTVRLVLALLFTVFLQLALVGLLWQVRVSLSNRNLSTSNQPT